VGVKYVAADGALVEAVVEEEPRVRCEEWAVMVGWTRRVWMSVSY